MKFSKFEAFALWAMLGYYLVTKAAPVVQAKVMTATLDAAWRRWDEGRLM